MAPIGCPETSATNYQSLLGNLPPSPDERMSHKGSAFTCYIFKILQSEYKLNDVNMCIWYVEIKCQLDATEVFIADLIACSTCFGHHYAHHQELKRITQWLLPVVFRVVVFKLLVWCGAEGYVSGLQDAAASCKPDA